MSASRNQAKVEVSSISPALRSILECVIEKTIGLEEF